MRAVIEKRIDQEGLFRFCIEAYFGPADGDEGLWPDGFWMTKMVSGLYASADEAEWGSRGERVKVTRSG
jgi:hypothetical protein